MGFGWTREGFGIYSYPPRGASQLGLGVKREEEGGGLAQSFAWHKVSPGSLQYVPKLATETPTQRAALVSWIRFRNRLQRDCICLAVQEDVGWIEFDWARELGGLLAAKIAAHVSVWVMGIGKPGEECHGKQGHASGASGTGLMPRLLGEAATAQAGRRNFWILCLCRRGDWRFRTALWLVC